mgnify:CR=1 FL=1
MQPIEAVFEHGMLKLLQRLPLREHQHVWLTILPEEPSAQHLVELAAQSPSFRFLGNPQEDRYSLQDGRPV